MCGTRVVDTVDSGQFELSLSRNAFCLRPQGGAGVKSVGEKLNPGFIQHCKQTNECSVLSSNVPTSAEIFVREEDLDSGRTGGSN